MGLGKVARFFCVVIQTTFRQLRKGRFSSNAVTKRISVSRRWIRKDSFKNFHFRGHLPPKSVSKIGQAQAPHSEQATGYVVLCREIMFTPRCSPMARVSEVQSTFLSDIRLQSYGASKLPNFWILAYFPYTKPQNVSSSDQPTAQGLHLRIIPIFPCGSWRSKRVPSNNSFPATSRRGAGDPKLAQIFAYGKWLYPYRLQLHASDISVTETITETEIIDPALTETMLIYETEII